MVTPPLPAYERRSDHAGLIAGLGPESFERGAQIFGRVCANCHGTKEQAGSLPIRAPVRLGRPSRTAPILITCIVRSPTASARWPRRPGWFPKQKYDLIHYIREAFFKTDNKSQYARVDTGYLAQLPRGNKPRTRAGRDRALEHDGLRAQPVGSRSKTAAIVPTSPTRGSPSGSTRGRAASLGASLGRL